MQSRQLLALASALVSLALLTACGSSSSHTSPSLPVFTSVPVTAAPGRRLYLPVGGRRPGRRIRHFFSRLVPTGATLSGNSVSWTPTAAQSRISNSFAVTATTTSGGTASSPGPSPRRHHHRQLD